MTESMLISHPTSEPDRRRSEYGRATDRDPGAVAVPLPASFLPANQGRVRRRQASPARADNELNALVRVRLAPSMEPGEFETHLRAEAGLAEAWRLAGDCDYEVRLSCPDLAALDSAVARLRGAGSSTATMLILRHVLPES